MNWEAITALSDFIAAIAVVISLVYIAIQVRIGAKALKTDLRDATFRTIMEWNYAVTADPALADLFQRSAADWDLLEGQERARAVHLMFSYFKLFENIYLHYLDGLVEEKVWLSNKQILLAYGTQPGAQYYLSNRMPVFDPKYQALLREMQPSAIVSGSELRGTKPRATE